MNKNTREILISDIKTFALDDGPGIRTTVFVKGCPLSCAWCHNPENISRTLQIGFYPRLCIGCGECANICPENAVRPESTNRIIRDDCTRCGACVDACPSTALKRIGQTYRVDELVDLLLLDHPFYKNSNGGVTFSGGEPTLHMDDLNPILQKLKKKDIHIAIQTAGLFDMKNFKEKLLPWIDLVFYDLKIHDPEKHRQYIGVENKEILENFKVLVQEKNIDLIPRVPLIPGITDTKENISGIKEFVRKAGGGECRFLPYNPGVNIKRAVIGLKPFGLKK